MKKIRYQPTMLFASLIILCTVLFSFTFKTAESVLGGEGFEVYMDNKLILQQFGKDMNVVKTIQFDQKASTGELAIRYFHCGKNGKSRVVTIKDEENNLLKQWKFGDEGTKLCCNVKQVFALPKIKAGKKLNLYYSSAEIPEGRLLAILMANNNAAQP